MKEEKVKEKKIKGVLKFDGLYESFVYGFMVYLKLMIMFYLL